MKTEKLINEIIENKLHDINKDQESLLKSYIDIVLKWHQKTNIISTNNPEYFVKREVYDCVNLCSHLKGHSYLDLGTGAGLPGVILAILNPDAYVRLLDRRGKAIRFLNYVNTLLKLRNTEIVHERLETMQSQHSIDTVLIKNFSNKNISGSKLTDRINYIHKYLSNKIERKFKMVFLTGSEASLLSSDGVKINHIQMNCDVSVIENPHFPQKRFILKVYD